MVEGENGNDPFTHGAGVTGGNEQSLNQSLFPRVFALWCNSRTLFVARVLKPVPVVLQTRESPGSQLFASPISMAMVAVAARL